MPNKQAIPIALTVEYKSEEGKAATHKMRMIALVLRDICGYSDTVRRLKNHPIKSLSDFLEDHLCYDLESPGEVFLFAQEVYSLHEDFRNSRNRELANLINVAKTAIESLIAGNLAIEDRVLEDYERGYFALIEERRQKSNASADLIRANNLIQRQ